MTLPKCKICGVEYKLDAGADAWGYVEQCDCWDNRRLQLGADILSKLKVGGKVSVTGDPKNEIFITVYDPETDKTETTTRRIR